MNKIRVIDLLNKIANGEEVPHFIIDEQEYYVGADGYLKGIFGDDVEWTLDYKWLNEEVQVLEEDKEIEELDLNYKDIIYGTDFKGQILSYCDNLQYKINEIIRELNELKKGK